MGKGAHTFGVSFRDIIRGSVRVKDRVRLGLRMRMRLWVRLRFEDEIA